jgi:DNA-binding response OmpR family regulator
MSGSTLCRNLREKACNYAPAFKLTARDTPKDKLEVLGAASTTNW